MHITFPKCVTAVRSHLSSAATVFCPCFKNLTLQIVFVLLNVTRRNRLSKTDSLQGGSVVAVAVTQPQCQKCRLQLRCHVLKLRTSHRTKSSVCAPCRFPLFSCFWCSTITTETAHTFLLMLCLWWVFECVCVCIKCVSERDGGESH